MADDLAKAEVLLGSYQRKPISLSYCCGRSEGKVSRTALANLAESMMNVVLQKGYDDDNKTRAYEEERTEEKELSF